MNTGEPRNNPIHDLWHNNKEVFNNGKYFTELITEKTIEYINNINKDQPFFIYVPYNAPHYPMHAPKKYVDRFPNLPPDRRIMAAMISAVDDSVGQIVDSLKQRGLLDNTVLFFQSDNGPSRESRNWLDSKFVGSYYVGTAGKFKGHKFSLFEGGIRSPGILYWQDKIKHGKVITEPAVSMDIFPTFLKLAGGNLDEYELDGKDLLPTLLENAKSPHKEIFWELNKQTAVRQGKWKLTLNGRLVEPEPPQDEVFLADLETDISESVNLKDKYPEIVKELTEKAQSWREKIEHRWKTEWLPLQNGTVTHK